MDPVDLSGLARGDESSSRLFEAGLRTIAARQGRFGAPRVLEHQGLHQVVVTELPPWRLLLNSDGIGTKVEVAERVGRYDTLGFDLLAMLADDAVRFGAQPLSLSNILDLHTADAGVVEGLARGLEAAARACDVAVVGGEVAELGARVVGRGASGGLNWAGTLLSVLAPGRELTGAEVRAGQAILALREPGLRCNGFTLARSVLTRAHGDEWHLAPAPDGGTFGDALLTPSRIYAPAVLAAREEAPITGVIHVTGGGIPGKLGRVLRGRGLGAELDDLFELPAFLQELQRQGGVDDVAAYRAWCCGQGMLLITPEPERLTRSLTSHGHEVRVAGRVVEGRGIHLRSRGARQTGETLHFAEDPQ